MEQNSLNISPFLAFAFDYYRWNLAASLLLEANVLYKSLLALKETFFHDRDIYPLFISLKISPLSVSVTPQETKWLSSQVLQWPCTQLCPQCTTQCPVGMPLKQYRHMFCFFNLKEKGKLFPLRPGYFNTPQTQTRNFWHSSTPKHDLRSWALW